MTNFERPCDICDTIYVIDDSGNLVNLTNIPKLEVWYYMETDLTHIIKFSLIAKEGYNLLTKVDDYHYSAYLTDALLDTLSDGSIFCVTYIAVENADLGSGEFNNVGTVELGINLITSIIP